MVKSSKRDKKHGFFWEMQSTARFSKCIDREQMKTPDHSRHMGDTFAGKTQRACEPWAFIESTIGNRRNSEYSHLGKKKGKGGGEDEVACLGYGRGYV